MQRTPAWKVSDLTLDRVGSTALVDQISGHIEAAITAGSLSAGARLPSWRDLTAQLGVARGTIKAAYEQLIDKELVTTAGSAGTHVVDPLPSLVAPIASDAGICLPHDFYRDSGHALAFQMGVPAHDAFPATLWSRLHRQGVQAASMRTGYGDPRGLSELRAALAAHLAITRGVECSPEQIIVTTGFRGGLTIALRAIDVIGNQAWIEDPGYPAIRHAVELAGAEPVPVEVDDEGLKVESGRGLAPQAALAVVTPGQHAPTGVPLSQRRRHALLKWADTTAAWIIEDDYLAELHLAGRSANALAAGPGADRVIHIGSFSKTLSPALGIGFLVAPLPLAQRLIDVALWLGAPPNAALQLALARFLLDGHYLRHLRRMRRLYAQRRRSLLETLARLGVDTAVPAGLSVLLPLGRNVDDRRLVAQARAADLSPAPFSPWFATASRTRSGLLLGIANVLDRSIERDCSRLLALIGGRENTRE